MTHNRMMIRRQHSCCCSLSKSSGLHWQRSMVPKSIKSIMIDETEYDHPVDCLSFTLGGFAHLKEIRIYENHFRSCNAFELSHLPSLETLVVGNNTFNERDMVNSKAKTFLIACCASLTTISIGEPFIHFASFRLFRREQE